MLCCVQYFSVLGHQLPWSHLNPKWFGIWISEQKVTSCCFQHIIACWPCVTRLGTVKLYSCRRLHIILLCFHPSAGWFVIRTILQLTAHCDAQIQHTRLSNIKPDRLQRDAQTKNKHHSVTTAMFSTYPQKRAEHAGKVSLALAGFSRPDSENQSFKKCKIAILLYYIAI